MSLSQRPGDVEGEEGRGSRTEAEEVVGEFGGGGGGGRIG